MNFNFKTIKDVNVNKLERRIYTIQEKIINSPKL